MTNPKMPIPNLMDSISQAWPFSQSLEFTDDGYFADPNPTSNIRNNVSATASHSNHAYQSDSSEDTDESGEAARAKVSLEITDVHAPVWYLMVSYSVRSSRSTRADGCRAYRDSSRTLPLMGMRPTTSMASPLDPFPLETIPLEQFPPEALRTFRLTAVLLFRTTPPP